MNLREFVLDNKKRQHLYHGLFGETFGKSLDNFMDPLLGFDIVKFDKYIAPPDGQSLSDFIAGKYGETARVLVQNLL